MFLLLKEFIATKSPLSKYLQIQGSNRCKTITYAFKKSINAYKTHQNHRVPFTRLHHLSQNMDATTLLDGYDCILRGLEPQQSVSSASELHTLQLVFRRLSHLSCRRQNTAIPSERNV